jgi:chemotaxis protein methyltransferase CheR
MSLARASQTASDVAVPGEFLFTWADFAVIADLLYRMSGIHLPEGKATLVYSRVAKRVRALGLPDFETYCDLVRSPGTEDEHSALLSALTTNVTRFFRESHHFDHLRDHVLPRLSQAATSGARVRLWSAGCSAGHEPYSMAMTVLEAIPDAASLDVRILASDIDPVIVRRAADAAYSGDDVEPVPGPLRSRYLVRNGTAWTVSDDVRRLVSFRTLNLLGDWPMRGMFDVIFCRNVAIYFDDPTQTRLFGRFGEAMHDGGQLYIGHSERAFAPTLAPDGLTSYRRTARHG